MTRAVVTGLVVLVLVLAAISGLALRDERVLAGGWRDLPGGLHAQTDSLTGVTCYRWHGAMSCVRAVAP